MKKSFLKRNLGEKLFDGANITFMIIFSFIMVYPFWNQFIVSLNEGTNTMLGGVYFFPRKFTIKNYAYVFERSNIVKGATVSVLRSVVGTGTHLIASGILAYVTTIKYFKPRNFVRFLFLATMYFGGSLIPTYLLYSQLGLTETFTVYWLPSLLGAYNMLLISSYIMGLPDSLAESARVDGASELRTYFSIIMPICKPVFAALAIMTAVNHWNSWFDVMIFNPSGKWDTLQVYLRKILLDAEQAAKLLSDQRQSEAMRSLTTTSVRAATTMIVTIPIVCIYPFFQKYFIGGITIGAVKG